jgi:hypothetical protein
MLFISRFPMDCLLYNGRNRVLYEETVRYGGDEAKRARMFVWGSWNNRGSTIKILE